MAADGSKFYYLLFCLKRMPARKAKFQEVLSEIDAELQRNPVNSEERVAMQIRLRSRSEALKNAAKER